MPTNPSKRVASRVAIRYAAATDHFERVGMRRRPVKSNPVEVERTQIPPLSERVTARPWFEVWFHGGKWIPQRKGYASLAGCITSMTRSIGHAETEREIFEREGVPFEEGTRLEHMVNVNTGELVTYSLYAVKRTDRQLDEYERAQLESFRRT